MARAPQRQPKALVPLRRPKVRGAPIAALAAASAAALAGGAPAQLVLLTDARYRGASACLDGSPYGVYFRPGRDSAHVLIVLQGAGFCTALDEPALAHTSCAFRALQPPNASSLGSSLGWPPAIGDGLTTLFGPPWLGLTSDDAALNPHLADYSLAFLPSCDGTAWSSDVAEPLPVANGTARVLLRGRENLDAALRWLKGERGLALASQVVLAGFSSGAAAVYLQLDHVASMLPASARLRGLADAGYMQNMVGELGTNFTHIRFANASRFWNASTNDACRRAFAGDEGSWACLVSQTVLPFVATPLFAIAASYDDTIPVFTGDAEIQCPYVFSKACSSLSLDWWRQYRNVTVANLAAAIPANGSSHGLYISACAPHCSSIQQAHNNTWQGIRVGGVSPADAFGAWLQGAAPARYIDEGVYGDNLSCLGWRG